MKLTGAGMRQGTAENLAAAWELRDALSARLQYVRWATIGTLLTLAFVQPLIGRQGVPTWLLILAFALYSFAAAAAAHWVSHGRSPARAAALDLAAICVLYAMGATPAGPLFVLFVLVTVCAAATNPLPLGLLYTGVAVVAVAAISPTLPMWTPTVASVRDLLTRLVFLAFVGVVTALLAGYLDTERQQAALSREQAVRQSELNRLRGAFVSAVSHDLRTPLTSIKAGLGMLETSLGERLRADEGRLLGAARRNCDRLSLLVDDLLAYHQLEAGALRLARTSLDLRDPATNALATVRPLFDEKGQRATLDLPGPLLCEGDARWLEHVMVNLLANAHHHTPPGTEVRVAGVATPREISLTVADEGPGIPAEELERVFVRFHRTAPTSAGSGLGLAIAKAVVEKHGGRIWAERGAERGTTFHVALPVAESAGAQWR